MTIQAPPRPRRPEVAPRRPPPQRARTRRPKARPTPPQTNVDPRLRARRVAVVREAGRRRLRRALLVLGFIAVVAAAIGSVFSPLLDVDEVTVSGATGARAEQVQTAARIEKGVPLLLLDTASAKTRIEALPWVASATVDRELPGTLAITVAERAPVAWVLGTDGSIRLVDATGYEVSVVPTQPAGLPTIGGIAVDPSITTTFPVAARVASELTPTLRPMVAGVFVAHDQAVLLLVGGVQVRLGVPQGINAKSRATEAVLAAIANHENTGGPVSYIDVRVPSAPVTG
jgi:cell division protein FtsQ